MPRRSTTPLDYLAGLILLIALGMVTFGVAADWWTRPAPGFDQFRGLPSEVAGQIPFLTDGDSLLTRDSWIPWLSLMLMFAGIWFIGFAEGPFAPDSPRKRGGLALVASIAGVAGIALTAYGMSLAPSGRGWEMTSAPYLVLAGWAVFLGGVVFELVTHDARIAASKKVVLVDRAADASTLDG